MSTDKGRLPGIVLAALWYALLAIVMIDMALIAACLISDSARQAYLEFKNFPEDSMIFHTAGFALWVKNQPIQTIQRELLLYSLGIEVLYNAVRLAILFIIRSMYRQAVSSGPFVYDNVVRLRVIGVIWAVSPQILNGLMYMAGSFFAPFVKVADSTAYPFFWVDYNALFVGGVLWLLAEVFRVGVLLREDQELTI